jgi:predicted GNAT superfamily acetyltransferase
VTDFGIRPFQTIEEFRACVELQEATWGEGFSERVPPAILKVAQILGGVSAGAYDPDGQLLGFVFGMTGVRDGELAHWSDMLAVREHVRDTGLGARLKQYQRDQVLARGVESMYWTFDPLQSRNAYLNFNKLGIVVREYVRDMYGDTDSPLHRGVGTDRFIALWQMSSDRVVARLAGSERGPESPPRDAHRVLDSHGVDGMLRPGEPDLGSRNHRLLVTIPLDVSEIMERSLDVALEWRGATRAVFTHYLGEGYEARELLRSGATSEYLLERRPES